MKKLILFVFIVILTFILYLFFRNDSFVQLKINAQTLKVEIADEKAEQELGLMNRESLSEDKGMLFVYQTGIAPNFWMKNMLIPLDMIFISPDKTINHIEKNIPPCTEKEAEQCPTYTSPFPTQYILEVNAGYAEKYKLKEGDTAEF